MFWRSILVCKHPTKDILPNCLALKKVDLLQAK